ncbi:MAG: TRAP transporter large permease [Ruminococcaceae bacterium]|nr:TRAP transporter large permease [Oscillospiraceae bacterium]
MNPIIIATVVLLVALFMKVPVFISVLAGSMSYFMLASGVPAQIFSQRVSSGMESITLLAVPFFVAAGVFMNYSGVTKRVMDFCSVVTGRMSGGLAQVNILLSTLMGGLSGSALADAAMEAKMLCPEMERQGFSKEFSSVVTATSSMITPLIPPGIAMILYGSIANVSIGKLFVSGIGVGLLLCAAMMILVSRISKKRDYLPLRTGPLPKGEFSGVLKKAALPLCLPIIIIGGIRLGIFTPTEAGSIAIVYALLLGLLYRELNWGSFWQGIKETIITTASIMLIVGAASSFAWVLTRERIPQRLTELIVQVITNKYLFLMVVNLFLLIVGMFIEGNAAMIVLVPLLAPIAAAYGIDEIQFAMVFIFNMAIGSLSPPMGTLMFVTCGVTKCKIKDFIREAVPFYIMLFICLMILTFIPFMSTGLVSLVY